MICKSFKAYHDRNNLSNVAHNIKIRFLLLPVSVITQCEDLSMPRVKKKSIRLYMKSYWLRKNSLSWKRGVGQNFIGMCGFVYTADFEFDRSVLQ